MADIPYARWYSDGTVAYTKGSTAITGTNTFWLSAGIKAGDIFVDPNGKIYEITAVNDSTSITLGKSYAGDTGTGKGYSIIRNFNGTMSPTLAKRVSILLNEFEKRYDLDMQTVTPKSAYDIAKDNGFTGTDAEWLETLSAYGIAVKNGYTGTVTEWLESLKAAGEWSKLDARTSYLTAGTIGLRNSLYRGKKLGDAVTDEQALAITNRTWTDMYLGDYWIINGTTYTIAEFTDNTMTTSYINPDGGGLCIITSKLAKKQMHSSDDVTSYAATDMFNVTIPELVETIIDPDFRGLAKLHYEWLDVGTSAWGQAQKQTKANLLSFANYWGFTYPYYNEKTDPYHDWQLPLFKYNLFIGTLYDNDAPVWTKTRTASNRFYFAYRDMYRGNHDTPGQLPTVTCHPVLYFYV